MAQSGRHLVLANAGGAMATGWRVVDGSGITSWLTARGCQTIWT
ncbi:MAG: hypothetical protein ACLUQC_11050 [Lactococcus raffinolactis]